MKIKPHFILVFLILSAVSINAQSKDKNFSPFSNSLVFSLNGGFAEGKTDYLATDLRLHTQGKLEYFLPSSSLLYWGFQLQGKYGQLNGKGNLVDAPNKFNTNLILAGAGASINYEMTPNILPYLAIGVDYTIIDSKQEGEFSNPISEVIIIDDSENAINFWGELGVRVILSQHISLFGSIGLNFFNKDNIDALYVDGSAKDFYATYNLGFSVALNLNKKVLDRDNDGIPDHIDKCPDKPEDYDGFQDEDGCPDLDNDRDGIEDKIDKCPDEAEDLDGFEDEDGCPDLDNDKDGIPDVIDKCPDDPEDLDGFEDKDGCPDIDNDNDGILDVDDDCPDKPETFNNFEDTDGCPDEAPKEVVIETPPPIKESPKTETKPSKINTPVKESKVIPNEFLIHGEVTFSSEGAEIKPSAFSTLNDIAAQINSSPNSKWRIEGHMDNSGTPSESKSISSARANAVMNYLISKGVSPSRLQSIGLGDQFPISSNSTAYGRMKNRRVVIKRIQ